MDFIVDLPPSMEPGQTKAYDAILVVVDRYTKVVKYIPCRKTIDAPELAKVFIKHWFKDQGLPESIVSDRGSVFTSKFWTALCYHLSITRRLSTAFHPQTDGQTERQNQIIEAFFRSYCRYHQDDWVELLPVAEFTHNNSFHKSIGMTPNQARYGINLDTRQGIEDDPLRGEIPFAKERAEKLVKIRQELEECWIKTKESQAKYYNKNHTPIEYNIGEWVLLSAANIITTQPSKKLAHRRLGAFKVKRRIGRQAYELDLPPRYESIHNVFHVSLLEPYRRRPGTEPGQITPEIVEGEELWIVETILDHKVTWRGGKPKNHYLVRWEGFGIESDQWVLKEDFTSDVLIREYHQRNPGRAPAQRKHRRRK
jgi:hypothetical protein